MPSGNSERPEAHINNGGGVVNHYIQSILTDDARALICPGPDSFTALCDEIEALPLEAFSQGQEERGFDPKRVKSGTIHHLHDINLAAGRGYLTDKEKGIIDIETLRTAFYSEKTERSHFHDDISKAFTAFATRKLAIFLDKAGAEPQNTGEKEHIHGMLTDSGIALLQAGEEPVQALSEALLKMSCQEPESADVILPCIASLRKIDAEPGVFEREPGKSKRAIDEAFIALANGESVFPETGERALSETGKRRLSIFAQTRYTPEACAKLLERIKALSSAPENVKKTPEPRVTALPEAPGAYPLALPAIEDVRKNLVDMMRGEPANYVRQFFACGNEDDITQAPAGLPALSEALSSVQKEFTANIASPNENVFTQRHRDMLESAFYESAMSAFERRAPLPLSQKGVETLRRIAEEKSGEPASEKEIIGRYADGAVPRGYAAKYKENADNPPVRSAVQR